MVNMKTIEIQNSHSLICCHDTGTKKKKTRKPP